MLFSVALGRMTFSPVIGGVIITTEITWLALGCGEFRTILVSFSRRVTANLLKWSANFVFSLRGESLRPIKRNRNGYRGYQFDQLDGLAIYHSLIQSE